jgi:Phage integrase family
VKFVFRRPGCEREASGIDEGINGVDKPLRSECQGLGKRRVDILRLSNVQRLDCNAEFLGFRTKQLELGKVVGVVAVQDHCRLIERWDDAFEQSNLWKLVKNLAAEGLVKPGLCFHGLRHSLGTALYDLGLDREARKAALGHSSDAASMVYERGGDRRAASDRAFNALDEHLARTVNKLKNGG